MRGNIKRKIVIAKNSGFCSGVERAVNLAESLAKKYDNVFTLDAILHNEEEVRRLEKLGVRPVKSLETKGDVIILPAHGATEEEISKAKKNFREVVDTTCPFVLRTVKIIKQLKSEGYAIAIVGDEGHRETKVLSETAGKNLIGVYRSGAEVPKKKFWKVGVVAQSTAFEEMLFSVGAKFLKIANETRIFNTICGETLRRQKEAREIAENADCVIVIGGKTSANSNRLYEMVKKVNERSFFIQNEKNVEGIKLENCKTIGIVSGTSTPQWLIEKIVKEISRL